MASSSFKVLGIGAETRDTFYVVPEFSVAEGVTQGILCFVNNESVVPTPAVLPTILP